MRSWYRFISVAIAACAFISNASTSVVSEAASPSDNTTYFAPLVEACPFGDSTCGKIEGKYLVQLRKGYEPSSHLSYISNYLHVDPVKEWHLKWHAHGLYSIKNVSTDSLNLLRQDPGVEEIEEGYWFQMSLVDRCQDSKYTEEEKAQCYLAKSLPPCEDPRLSEEQKRACYGATLLDPCENPMLTEVEKRSCQGTSLLDSHEGLEHSEDDMRSCCDPGLVDTSNNPMVSKEEGTCAGPPRTTAAANHGWSEEL